jgi:hypothetical protein
VRFEVVMCEKCVEIDGRIDHYGILGSRITDPALLDGIKELLERLHDLKVALHPERPSSALPAACENCPGATKRAARRLQDDPSYRRYDFE